MEHTQNAIQHLEKARRKLALADQPKAYAEVSNLKRNLEIADKND